MSLAIGLLLLMVWVLMQINTAEWFIQSYEHSNKRYFNLNSLVANGIIFYLVLKVFVTNLSTIFSLKPVELPDSMWVYIIITTIKLILAFSISELITRFIVKIKKPGIKFKIF